MFMLSQRAINEFKQIYLIEHKVKLTDQETASKAIKLLMLIKTIYKPIPKEKLNEARKKA